MIIHTYLWKVVPSKELYEEDDESIGDYLFTPSDDAKNLFENNNDHTKRT